MRRVETGAALAAILAYFSYVSQLFRPETWASGLGDWGDPYFINVLLEHWFQQLPSLSGFASPPMFYPAERTLGYSHGLILYAPYYVLVRLFAQPFQAHTISILLVLVTGSISLYVILRSHLDLSFAESLALSAFFFTSRNVVNGGTSIWSQTASVFLIPPILLITLLAIRMRIGPSRYVLAALSGFASTLLLTQDFYTGLFAWFFASAAFAMVLFAGRQPSIGGRLMRFWRGEPRNSLRVASVIAVLAGLWTLIVIWSGGAVVEAFGIRLVSRDWRRPALLCLIAVALLIYRKGDRAVVMAGLQRHPWFPAFAAGAAAGCAVFLWIYFESIVEHRSFPADQLSLNFYDSIRPFCLALVAGVFALLPSVPVERKTRKHAFWLLVISTLVLLIPIRIGSVSIWASVFAPIAGFSAIRDPRRIIHVYELVLVLAVAVFVSRLGRASVARTSMTMAALVLMLADWNREVFALERPTAEFRRWIEAPVQVDASCQSFFIEGASETYMARWNHKWVQYGVDATFIALRTGVPTLNGYSAWVPAGWGLANPQESDYLAAVDRWIEANRLLHVCALDIDRRTMTPYAARTGARR